MAGGHAIASLTNANLVYGRYIFIRGGGKRGVLPPLNLDKFGMSRAVRLAT